MANSEQLRDGDLPPGDVGPGRRHLSSRKVRALGGAGLLAVLGAGGYGIVALASTGSAAATLSTSLAAVDASTTGGSPPAGGFGGFGSHGHGTPPAAAGTVKSVDTAGNSFVVTSFKGADVTVDVGSATTYRDPKVTSPSFSNVTTGERVMVRGTTASGTVTATSVAIMPAGGSGGFGGFGSHGHGTPPAAAGTSGATVSDATVTS